LSAGATVADRNERRLVGLTRFELVTPRLSSVCSNQLSYRPSSSVAFKEPDIPLEKGDPVLSKLDRTCLHFIPCLRGTQRMLRTTTNTRSIFRSYRYTARDTLVFARVDRNRSCARRPRSKISRKEVIQPQVLLQLPCYDFTPITDHTLGAYLPCGLTRRLLVQPAFVM
jgi:hypothetical protein